MSKSPILQTIPLDFQWPTADPFLFCVHHNDAYPQGNEVMGPPGESLAGRNIGQDFETKDGWRMYHGDTVPGFPAHPHRGFETVTVVQKGLVDHSDSLGAAGRYGNGDTQWLTTGKGVQHSEMFPLVHTDKSNPMELFQIWLNLPRKSKFAEPHFAMFWSKDTPRLSFKDDAGRETRVEITAGELDGTRAPAPPPDSWAADPDNEVAIWIIEMEANASWTLPATAPAVNRILYFFEGDTMEVADNTLGVMTGTVLQADAAVRLTTGKKPARLLLLQGKPIDEPVVQYGPFVMNSREEIQQAYRDYQESRFGGWPWPEADHVHPRDKGRFALYADGKEESP